jgi:hypothetical protein
MNPDQPAQEPPIGYRLLTDEEKAQKLPSDAILLNNGPEWVKVDKSLEYIPRKCRNFLYATRVTPTHAPSEGQTEGPPQGWPAYAENLARKLGEMTRERDDAIASQSQSHAQIDAQLAVMRLAFDKAPHDPSCKYPSLNPAHQKHCTCWKFEANKVGTSGQALLDRLAEAEKDKALLDWLEKTPAGIGVPFMGEPNFHIFSDKGDGEGPTLREAIASAMRKDGHE